MSARAHLCFRECSFPFAGPVSPLVQTRSFQSVSTECPHKDFSGMTLSWHKSAEIGFLDKTQMCHNAQSEIYYLRLNLPSLEAAGRCFISRCKCTIRLGFLSAVHAQREHFFQRPQPDLLLASSSTAQYPIHMEMQVTLTWNFHTADSGNCAKTCHLVLWGLWYTSREPSDGEQP